MGVADLPLFCTLEWSTFIFRDIWPFDDNEARQTSLWMAGVLTEATVDESQRGAALTREPTA